MNTRFVALIITTALFTGFTACVDPVEPDWCDPGFIGQPLEDEPSVWPFQVITCGPVDKDVRADTCYDLEIEFIDESIWRDQRPDGWGYGERVMGTATIPIHATCHHGADNVEWRYRMIWTTNGI